MYIPIRHSPPSSIVTMFRGQLNHTGCPEVQRNLSLAWVDRSGDYRYRVKQKQSSQVLGLAGYNVATTWWSFGVDSRTFEGDSRNLAEQFFTQLCTQQCIMKLPEGTSSSVQRKAAVAVAQLPTKVMQEWQREERRKPSQGQALTSGGKRQLA